MSDQPLKIVELRVPKLTMRDGTLRVDGCDWPDGSIEILLDDFVYVRVNYDYRYTDNASRRNLADKIMAMLTPNAKLSGAAPTE